MGIDHSHSIKELLTFYMGKNTPERQEFIIRNLRVEQDILPPDGPATPDGLEEKVA